MYLTIYLISLVGVILIAIAVLLSGQNGSNAERIFKIHNPTGKTGKATSPIDFIYNGGYTFYHLLMNIQ